MIIGSNIEEDVKSVGEPVCSFEDGGIAIKLPVDQNFGAVT
jgi:hypothetical protein